MSGRGRMRAISFGCALIPTLVGLVGAGASPISAKTTPKPVIKMVWSQEFNGKAGLSPEVQTSTMLPNRKQIWQTEVNGTGGGNRERQFYTDGPVSYTSTGKIAHYAIELDGKSHLAINAARVTPASGARPSNAPLGTCWYAPGNPNACEFVSGRISTAGKVGFKYGLLEARIKLPNAWNSWPAWWMLGANHPIVGWPKCGEIDIMEAAASGGRYFTVFGTLHTFPDDGFGVGSQPTPPDNLYTAYHTYGLLWDKTKVQWLFDGKPFFTATKKSVTGSEWLVNGKNRSWPFDQEMFMILNVAMGGTLGGDANGNVDPDSMGGTMLVDWIHFSTVNGVGTVIRH